MNRFTELAEQVHENGGREAPGGYFLREIASSVALVCEECSELDGEGVTYWITLANMAMTHAQQTGHQVVADLWQAAVFGPGPEAEPEQEKGKW